MSTVNVNAIDKESGSTLTLGGSGTTVQPHASATVSGFGKLLQVVQATKSDTATTNSNSVVTTGLEASITPSATSSKVLVLVSFSYSAAADVNSIFQLYRDSSAIHLGDTASARERASVGTLYQDTVDANVHSASIHALDSPSSTSSITYKLMYFVGRSGASTYVSLNRGFNDTDNDSFKRSISSITLMEIEG
jgi:hypothetical protein